MKQHQVEVAARAVLDVLACRPTPHNLANARRIAIAVLNTIPQLKGELMPDEEKTPDTTDQADGAGAPGPDDAGDETKGGEGG